MMETASRTPVQFMILKRLGDIFFLKKETAFLGTRKIIKDQVGGYCRLGKVPVRRPFPRTSVRKKMQSRNSDGSFKVWERSLGEQMFLSPKCTD